MTRPQEHKKHSIAGHAYQKPLIRPYRVSVEVGATLAELCANALSERNYPAVAGTTHVYLQIESAGGEEGAMWDVYSAFHHARLHTPTRADIQVGPIDEEMDAMIEQLEELNRGSE